MKFSSSKNSLFSIILVSLIIGSIVRIAYLWKYPVPVRDAFTYSESIEEWMRAGKIPEKGGFPPLGLFFFKKVAVFSGLDIIKSGTLVNVSAGLLIVATLGTIAHIIIPYPPLVLFVSLVSATHPALVDYSCQATRENTYLLFCCLSVLFLIRYLKSYNKLRHIAAAAFFACAAFLCRHEGMELPILAFLVILFHDKNAISIRLSSVLLFSVTFALSFFLISFLIGVPLSYYASYIIRYQEILLL